MLAVDNTFEQHLRSVLPELSEDKVKLVMALQDKAHAKVLELGAAKTPENVSAVVNAVINEVRGVLGEDFRKVFGDWENIRLIDPKKK